MGMAGCNRPTEELELTSAKSRQEGNKSTSTLATLKSSLVGPAPVFNSGAQGLSMRSTPRKHRGRRWVGQGFSNMRRQQP